MSKNTTKFVKFRIQPIGVRVCFVYDGSMNHPDAEGGTVYAEFAKV